MPITATWNAASGNWFSPGNWDEPNPNSPPPILHYVPGSDNDVQIPDQSQVGTAFAIGYNGTSTVRSLTSAANATLNVTGGLLKTLHGGNGFGTLNVSSGATFEVAADTFSLNAGTFDGTVSGAGSLRFINGTFKINAGATVTVDTWLLTYQVGSGTVSTTNFNASLTYAGNFQLLQVFGNYPIVKLLNHTLTLSGTVLLEGISKGVGTIRVTGDGTFAGSFIDGAKLVVSGSLDQTGLSSLGGTLKVDAGGLYSITAPADIADLGDAIIVNNGTFRQIAQGASRVDASFTNNGTLSVSAGSELIFADGLADSQTQLNGTASGAGQLTFGFAANVTLNTTTLSVATLVIAGGNGGGTTTLGRDIAYAGKFNFSHTGTLDLNGHTLTLSGVSQLNLGNIDGAGTLRITGSATIDAISLGYLGTAATLRNSGTITQNGSVSLTGTILNDAGKTYTLKASTIANPSDNAVFTNKGTLSIASGFNEINATLTSSGAIGIASGATLQLRGTSTLGGTINGAGTLNLAGTATITTGISTGALNFLGTTTLGTDLVYAGTFSIGTFSATNLDGHTLSLNGAANLNTGFNRIGGTGTVKILGTTTLGGVDLGSSAGATTLQNLGTVNQVGSIALNGTILNEKGHLYTIGYASISNSGATFTNRGTLSATGLTADINAVFTNDAASGAIAIANGSTLRLASTTTLGGSISGAGRLVLAGTAKVNTAITTGALDFNGITTLGVDLAYAGKFSIGVFSTLNLAGHTLTLSGVSSLDTGFNTINGSGTVKVTGTMTINGVAIGSSAGAVTLQNSGVIEQTGGFSLTGKVINDAGRTYTLANGNIDGNAGSLINNGTFEKEGATGGATIFTQFTNNGLLVVNDGSLLLHNLVNVGVVEGVISTNGNQITVTADTGSGKTLTGGTGNNTLNGGAGIDTMAGGAGKDTYIVGNAGDKVIEKTGEGSDTVTATVSYTLAAGQEIETAQLATSTGTQALDLTGNEFVNTLIGNAGANVLDGKLGADTLRGRGGSDTYAIDNAGDKVLEVVGEGTDKIISTVSYQIADNQSVEVLQFASAVQLKSLNMTGNNLANTIYGTKNANVLDGKGAADILTGRDGADTFSFSTALGSSNVDHITDLVAADDQIRLLKSVFSGLAVGELPGSAFKELGFGAPDGNDKILYDRATGKLFYDADALGSSAPVQFATLDTKPVLSHADFFVV